MVGLRMLLTLGLLAGPAYAVAPPPCSSAPPLTPANFAIHYLGATSNCSQNGGDCLPGEAITFQAVSAFDYGSANCALGYSWNFHDGSPIAGGVMPTQPHTFAATGNYNVQLTITSAIATQADVIQPVLVSANIPALNHILLTMLAGALLLLGIARLPR